MSSFYDRLTERARSADSLLCVGLDPHLEDLPEATAEAARVFCLTLIEATVEHACAFKPNSAFFEALGSEGWAALEQIVAAVPREIPVILDAKRGDIASTARAYAAAAFDRLGVTAITLSPYLGYDAIAPFLAEPEHGAFLLCKTSNPSADEIQSVGERPLYLHIANLAVNWNQKNNLGLVVGATDPAALARVREIAPDLWILAPGVGAQGGDLGAALRAGLRADGSGLVIPISRAIARAEDPAREAEALRQAINRERIGMQQRPEQAGSAAGLAVGLASETGRASLSPSLQVLADELLGAGCIQFGEFKLRSGILSPIYIDLRLLAGRPRLLSRVAAAYIPTLERLSFDRLAAIPYAALPIAAALSLQMGIPWVYPRKGVKDYGTQQRVEGGFERGERVVILDDLATTGGSKLEAAQVLRDQGLQVQDIVVLIDREGGAGVSLAEAGLRFHAIFTLSALLDHWERTGAVASQQLSAVKDFIHADRR